MRKRRPAFAAAGVGSLNAMRASSAFVAVLTVETEPSKRLST